MMGLDFETYGTRDLRTVGLDRYLSDPGFRPLIAATHEPSYRHAPLVFDFVTDDSAYHRFTEYVKNVSIVAHNAGFEYSVLRTKFPEVDVQPRDMYDSAVLARAMGASSSLENSVQQLLTGAAKMSEGKRLIQKFSVPNKYGVSEAHRLHALGLLEDDPDWQLFKDYCALDAKLSYELYDKYGHSISKREWNFHALTLQMNQRGWKVDLPSVEEMQRRYLENLEDIQADFHDHYDPKQELNLNSLKQLKEWCAERGVKATSFDEASVEKMCKAIASKMMGLGLDDPKRLAYGEVLAMLRVKQELGGSSLKKLKVILNTTGEDGRLRNQYMHVGAGQSYRTSGRGVQMQNLKRLKNVADMTKLHTSHVQWDNEELAENIRQVFTATDPIGELIVGDYSSVESRGLAWLAGEQWKLDSYKDGKDLYKVQASKIYDVEYGQVTKDQRQGGKVGELSCGYGAGPGAVKSFAEKMGVPLTEDAATELVVSWRDANPAIVELWGRLDELLSKTVAGLSYGTPVGYQYMLQGYPIETPESLTRMHPGAQSIMIELRDGRGQCWLQRVIHGCYQRGRNICYYKPSDRVTGDPWSAYFTDPKTKQRKYYSIYGGKLTGILTQSFCREIFFRGMVSTARAIEARTERGLHLVGQFHDELVLDWSPSSGLTLAEAKQLLSEQMVNVVDLNGFPLEADVKSDYRYTK